MKTGQLLDGIQDLSFGDAFKTVMNAYGFNNSKLAKVSAIPSETISRYRNGRTRPTKSTLVQLCFEMNLAPDVSFALLEKAGICIHTTYNDDIVYSVLLEQSATLDVYDANIMIEEANARKSFDDKDIKPFKVIL